MAVDGAGDARVLEGHSFIVGAAVSIGGRDIKPGINVHRFANRIPLLFEVQHCAARGTFGVPVVWILTCNGSLPQHVSSPVVLWLFVCCPPACTAWSVVQKQQAELLPDCLCASPPPPPPPSGRQAKWYFTRSAKMLPSLSLSVPPCLIQAMQGGSDVITKTALKRINWAAYKINQATDKIGVFVSIVSTKIPYKGAGKEYIGTSTSRMFTHVLHMIAKSGCLYDESQAL